MASTPANVAPMACGSHQRRRTSGRPSEPGGARVGNEALLAHIRAIQIDTKGEYGWPRVWKELRGRGIRVGKDRVQRIMQAHGIKARGKRKFVVTTDSKHELPVAPTCWSGTSTRRRPTWSGAAISPTSPQTKAGCTWLR